MTQQTAILGPRAGVRTLADASIPWTQLRHDPPTKPGFYFLEMPGHESEVVQICQHKGHLHIWSASPHIPFTLRHVPPTAYWTGAIPCPTPPPFLSNILGDPS